MVVIGAMDRVGMMVKLPLSLAVGQGVVGGIETVVAAAVVELKGVGAIQTDHVVYIRRFF